MLGRKIKYKNQEIEPDEIFLDSSNLPEFDVHQFEGRIEKPISKKTAYAVLYIFFLLALSFLFQAGVLQIARGALYLEVSKNNHLKQIPIFSNRGVIYDKNDTLLAWNAIAEDEKDFASRKYTDLSGLSHILGYVSYPAKDSSGFYYRSNYIGEGGVEESYNLILEGEHGLKITEVNAKGEIISESLQKPPKDGETLRLSVDADLTHKLYEIIRSTSEKVGFEGGAGIIMNVKNGEIIAMTSYPEFDSAIMSEGRDVTTIQKFLTDSRKPFLNRAISGLYTPGSIIKPFIAMAALNEKVISPYKEILSTGSIKIANPYVPGEYTIFNDWKAHGLVDMRRALAVSSNVYFFEIGGGYAGQKGIGIANILKYSKIFGIGEIAGIDISGEVEGTIPSPEWKAENFDGEIWRVGDTYNTAIGQYGFQVTALQMIRAIASVANGGVLPVPHLVEGQGKPGEKLNMPTSYFEIVREGMRQGTLSGTGTGLNVPYLKVATKTGTAEIGTLSKKYVNSWVTGFFPYDNPTYAFIVVMDKGPRGNLIGGVAVMRQLLDWMYYNTPEYFLGTEESLEVLPEVSGGELPTQPNEIGD